MQGPCLAATSLFLGKLQPSEGRCKQPSSAQVFLGLSPTAPGQNPTWRQCSATGGRPHLTHFEALPAAPFARLLGRSSAVSDTSGASRDDAELALVEEADFALASCNTRFSAFSPGLRFDLVAPGARTVVFALGAMIADARGARGQKAATAMDTSTCDNILRYNLEDICPHVRL